MIPMQVDCGAFSLSLSLFLERGNNLLSEKCGHALPTHTDYAPFYAGLLFPFYGSMK